MFGRLGRMALPLIGAIVWSLSPSWADEPRKIAGWGQFVDPAGDCVLAEKGGGVSITVPGEYRDLVSFEKLKNTRAPRVIQQLEGDFTLLVLARKFAFPEPNSGASAENRVSYVSSGLVIWQDKDTFLRLQRGVNGDSKMGPAPFIHANQFAGGKMIGNVVVRLDFDEDLYLRIQRKAGKVALAYARGGKSWTDVEMVGAQQPLTDPVQAGVFVINATNKEISHEFADLRLTK